ncbi:MAG: sulfate/molybdate ABC transporter ATP-binding protein [Pseudomarimonas sp.]
MDLTIDRLHKRYGGFAALHGIDLKIPSGELIALLGPSGSGKTSLLRAIAGLLPIDEGRILFGEADATELTLRERRVGFVFQHYALFRHLSVFENIAFGLRSRRRSERPVDAEIDRRVRALLQRVQLAELGERFPDQLSGGQRQRVALARAMAIDPTVLLLDEPFGALDAKVRVELRRWLRQIHDDTGYTTVFVTHDQEEALELADRVVVLNQGRIEQVGTPAEVYDRPASAFVFDFIGRGSALPGHFDSGRFVADGESFAVPLQSLVKGSGRGRLLVRPHALRLVAEGQGLRGKVSNLRHLAGRTTLEIQLAQQDVRVELDLDATHASSAPIRGALVDVLPSANCVFAPDQAR